MKTILVFLTFFSTFFFVDRTFAVIYFPGPECVINSNGNYDGNNLKRISNVIRCRTGQRMKIVTSMVADMETDYCCCKWDATLSAVQTSQNELKFYAHRCEFKDDDSKVPERESLLVTGNDLYCFIDEKLVNFKAEINGKIQDMSCCKKVPRTTTTKQTTTTTLETTTERPNPAVTEQMKESDVINSETNQQAPSEAEQQQIPSTNLSQPPDQKITLLESQNVIVSLIPDLTKTDVDEEDDAILQVDTSPVPHIKLRAQASSAIIPDTTVASECVYASSTSTEPVKGYMSYDEPGVTLACRSQQVMINLTTINPDDGNTYNIHCCKFDPKLPALNPLPTILAHPCEFDESGTLQSYSGVKPGADLVCDSNYDLVTVSTTDLVKQTRVTLSCCKLKPETTTASTTTTKMTTSVTTTTTTATTTAKATTATTSGTTNSSLNLVGAECVYLSDGSIKINYMDYCDDGRLCRSQQFIKTVVRSSHYDRCCCQFNKDLPIKDIGIKLKAFDCVFKPDGTIRRWSLVASGPDITCDPGFKIKQSVFYENNGDVSMSCCIPDVPETTTVAATTTTTLKPVGTTTQAPPPVPIVGIQCSYNEDQTIKTGFMDPCTTNFACRSKEVRLEMTVPISGTNSVKKCCCDYQKDLPVNIAAVPAIIAPKCIYDQEGYVNMWSVVETGTDLGCRVSDNLMTYDVGYESNKMSCCLKKDAVTISTTMRTSPATTEMTTTTTPLTSTSTTTSPLTSTTAITEPTTTTASTTTTTQPTVPTTLLTTTPHSSTYSRTPTADKVYKSVALECVYLKNGTLNVDFMDWYSATIGCRSQYVVRKVSVQSSDNKMYTKMCCEYNSSLPFDPSLPPLVAPTCYFSSRTTEIARWSIELSGPDIVCNVGFYMYNTTILWNGVDTGFSCCQPDGKPIPTLKPMPTTVAPSPGQTTESPMIQPNQTGPQCRYRADKSLSTDYMEVCGYNLVCLSQQVILEQKTVTTIGNSINLCCCDLQADLPSVPPTSPFYAPKCQFDIYGNINVYSVVAYVSNVKCGDTDELRNFTMEISSKLQTMSCCILKDETTIATTPRMTGPGGPMLDSTTISGTTTTNPPTTLHKGKRTVPPNKNFPPKRVVGANECPDCIYPESGPVDSLKMIIQHLSNPGPALGLCPFKTHTLRIIHPLPHLGYREGRCCCENDQHPLPYSFS